MKIFDLKEYREKRVNHQEDGFLEKDYKVLLEKVQGAAGSLDGYLLKLSNIASVAHLQVFYELLQNAQDAGASSLYVYMKNGYFMAINNGEKFGTTRDENNNDNLWSFLCTNKGMKVNTPEAIGKFGIGSKLLYTLLTDAQSDEESFEKIKNELVNKNNSVILFSWDDNQHLQNLANWNINKFIPQKDDGSGYPIFAKLIYSFMPVCPEETKTASTGNLIDLFPKTEVDILQNFIDNKTYRQYQDGSYLELSDLPQGSLLFLKLGNQIEEKINSSWERINKGISISLNFFLNDTGVEKIVFNGRGIQKAQLKKLDGHIITDSKKTVSYNIAYPVESFLNLVTSKSSVNEEINLFRFAPAGNEKHGLWFYINSEFELADDRQQLRWNGYNQSLIVKITDEIIQHAFNKKNNAQDYWFLYRVILFSSLKTPQDQTDDHQTVALKYLTSKLKNFLKNSILTTTGNYLVKDQVALTDSRLNIPLQQLGITSFEWAYLGDSDQEKKLTRKRFGPNHNVYLKEISIKDIIVQANPIDLQNWIQSLIKNEYEVFINDVEDDWNSSLFNVLQNVKWIKGNDSKWYSIKDYRTQASFWVKDKRTVSILSILQGRLSHIVSTIDFSDKKNINKELHHQLDNNIFFKKLVSTITVPTETVKLTPSDKKTIVLLLKNRLEVANNTIASIAIFQNKDNNLVPLNKLVCYEAVKDYSLIPNNYKIHAGEQDSIFEEYQLNKGEVFSSLIDKNWSVWVNNLGQLNSKLINAFYDMVQSFYLAGRKPDHSLDDLKCIYISSTQLEKNENCISIDYDTKKETAVANLLQKLDNKKAVHLDIKEKIGESTFIFHNALALHEIVPQQIDLTLNEVSLLMELCVQNDIKPFYHFWFEESATDNTFTCNKRPNGETNTSAPRQFHTDNADLISFLSTNNDVYRIIPPKIFSLKESKSANGLRTDGKPSLGTLISNYGFQRDFLSRIKEINDDGLSEAYINSLPSSFIFIDKLNNSFRSSDFEWMFSELASRYITLKRGQEDNKISALKSKLLINGNALSDLEWSDIVEIIIIKDDTARPPTHFSLSTLLPTYKGKSNILSEAITCFPSIGQTVINNLFESKNKAPDDVAISLAQNPALINTLEHFRFVMAWLYDSKRRDLNYHSSYKGIFIGQIQPILNSNQQKCLDSLFGDGFDFFSTFINFKDWTPKERALLLIRGKSKLDLKNQKYLLSEERLPEWVSTWHNNNPKKLEFLINCKVKKFQIDSNPIEWRSFFDGTYTTQPTEKTSIERWGANTLEWVRRNNNQWQEQNPMTPVLISYIKKVNDETKDSGFAFCYESSKDDYKLIQLSKSNQYGVFENNDTFQKIKSDAIDKVLNDYKFDLLIEKSQMLEQLKSKGYQILTIEIKNNIDIDSVQQNSPEWKAPQYSDNWKEKYKYRIFIHNKDIPSVYSIHQTTLITPSVDVTTISDESHYFPNPELYLSQPRIDEKGSVEKLLRTLVPPFSNDALLDLYEEKKSADREDNNKDREVAVSNAEWDIIKLLLNNGILSIEDAQKLLNSGKGKGNGAEEGDEKRDVQPNMEIGHKGEIILYEYLCHKYGKDTVFWASKEIKEPRYDFAVYRSEDVYRSKKAKDVKYYFDAKTTGQSKITPDSIPFYVKKSQLEFLKNEHLNNYILVRLNLNTLQLEKNIFPEIIEMGDKESGYQLIDYVNNHNFDDKIYDSIVEEHADFLNLSEEKV